MKISIRTLELTRQLSEVVIEGLFYEPLFGKKSQMETVEPVSLVLFHQSRGKSPQIMTLEISPCSPLPPSN